MSLSIRCAWRGAPKKAWGGIPESRQQVQLGGCSNEWCPTEWGWKCCWEELIPGKTDRLDESGVSCFHLSSSQLSRLWKTFANKHSSPKLTSWQRRGKKSLERIVSLQEWGEGGRRGKRSDLACSLLKKLIFLTAVLQVSFFFYLPLKCSNFQCYSLPSNQRIIERLGSEESFKIILF